MTVVSGILKVEYHLFGVTDLAVGPFASGAVGPMRLVMQAVGGALIYTGIAMGPVHVAIEVRTRLPSEVDGSWEDIAEVSLEVAPPAQHPDGQAFLLQLAREKGNDPEPRGFRVAVVGGGTPEEFPVLNPAGGSCRLRVHARGRGMNYDCVDWEPHEEYLLVAWPAPVAEEAMYKQVTAY